MYEKILRIPYYIVFDGITNELFPFHLTKNGYRPLEINSSKVWIPTLNIGLGFWEGEYEGCQRQWLRWYDAEGNLIPTKEEKEQMAKELAQQERDRERMAKELAQQQVQELLERLRKAGIDP